MKYLHLYMIPNCLFAASFSVTLRYATDKNTMVEDCSKFTEKEILLYFW